MKQNMLSKLKESEISVLVPKRDIIALEKFRVALWDLLDINTISRLNTSAVYEITHRKYPEVIDANIASD